VLDGSLSAQAANLKRIPTVIKGLSAPGSLAAQARFEGTVAQLGLRDILVHWQGPEQSSLTIQGGIDDLDDLAGVALDVSGRLDDAAWLAPALPETLGVLKQAEVRVRLSGDPRQLNVRELSLSATDANRLHLSMRGQQG